MGRPIGPILGGMEVTRTIPVELSSGTYDVVVGHGLLGDWGRRVRDVAPATKCVIVADPNVGDYLPAARAALGSAGYEVIDVTLAGGEAHKTLDGMRPAYDAALSAGIDRRTPVIGFGGGVTTDMAGFLAATLLRGVPLVQMPTSLLAMVDASVGGKTGVNHAAGKNLIGAFHQPRLVICDVDLLATLPGRELRCGLAECVKHDVIRDAGHFRQLGEVLPAVLAGDVAARADLVAHNVAIKAAVVKDDPHEHGVRAHLNLGHTFAHAIEKVTRHAVPHGEAVGLGLCAAAELATRTGGLSATEAAAVRRAVGAAGLPTGGLDADAAKLVAAMRFDKKVRDGRLRFVLPAGLGAARVAEGVPEAEVLAATGSICR